MSLGRFIPVFTAAFPFIYVPTMAWNLPLLSYLPRSGQWHLFVLCRATGAQRRGRECIFGAGC